MPVPDSIKFRTLTPQNRVGRYFSDQIPLEFPLPVAGDDEYGDLPDPPVSATGAKEVKYTRLIYVYRVDSGRILVRNFQSEFYNAEKSMDWVSGKINHLDADLVNVAYNSQIDGELIYRGFNQEFTNSTLVFIYLANGHFEFVSPLFSAAQISPAVTAPPAGNPFSAIDSTDDNLISFYNIFVPDLTKPYKYKFNLHLKMPAVYGDTPQMPIVVIDPDIKNQGPPS